MSGLATARAIELKETAFTKPPRRLFLGVIGSAYEPKRCPMADVTYEIVQHDGGWAYKVNGVFSEPFMTHDEALRRRPGGRCRAGNPWLRGNYRV